MGKFYYVGEFYQEYSDKIEEIISNQKIPTQNIKFSRDGFKPFHMGVYIKFESENDYKRFCKLDLPGLVEKIM